MNTPGLAYAFCSMYRRARNVRCTVYMCGWCIFINYEVNLLLEQKPNMPIACGWKHCVDFGHCGVSVCLRYEWSFLIISIIATILAGLIKLMHDSRYIWTAHSHYWRHFLYSQQVIVLHTHKSDHTILVQQTDKYWMYLWTQSIAINPYGNVPTCNEFKQLWFIVSVSLSFIASIFSWIWA